MSKMRSPSPHGLHEMQTWLRRPNLGAVYLTGRDRDIWAQGVDLMSLGGGRLIGDQFTGWFANHLLPKYHRFVGSYLVSDVLYPCG